MLMMGSRRLVGLDNLTIAIKTTVPAHVMRKLGGATLWAHAACWGAHSIIRTTASIGPCTARLTLGYCHFPNLSLSGLCPVLFMLPRTYV